MKNWSKIAHLEAQNGIFGSLGERWRNFHMKMKILHVIFPHFTPSYAIAPPPLIVH